MGARLRRAWDVARGRDDLQTRGRSSKPKAFAALVTHSWRNSMRPKAQTNSTGRSPSTRRRATRKGPGRGDAGRHGASGADRERVAPLLPTEGRRLNSMESHRMASKPSVMGPMGSLLSRFTVFSVASARAATASVGIRGNIRSSEIGKSVPQRTPPPLKTGGWPIPTPTWRSLRVHPTSSWSM